MALELFPFPRGSSSSVAFGSCPFNLCSTLIGFGCHFWEVFPLKNWDGQVFLFMQAGFCLGALEFGL